MKSVQYWLLVADPAQLLILEEEASQLFTELMDGPFYDVDHWPAFSAESASWRALRQLWRLGDGGL